MPKKVDEVKEPESIRMKPSVRKAIIQEYGSVSAFINMKIDNDRKLQKRIKENCES